MNPDGQGPSASRDQMIQRVQDMKVFQQFYPTSEGGDPTSTSSVHFFPQQITLPEKPLSGGRIRLNRKIRTQGYLTWDDFIAEHQMIVSGLEKK